VRLELKRKVPGIADVCEGSERIVEKATDPSEEIVCIAAMLRHAVASASPSLIQLHLANLFESSFQMCRLDVLVFAGNQSIITSIFQ
jgi:hypothetical protein